MDNITPERRIVAGSTKDSFRFYRCTGSRHTQEPVQRRTGTKAHLYMLGFAVHSPELPTQQILIVSPCILYNTVEIDWHRQMGAYNLQGMLAVHGWLRVHRDKFRERSPHPCYVKNYETLSMSCLLVGTSRLWDLF